MHFIEANGFPRDTCLPDFLTRTFMTEMMNLAIELHEAPIAFETMTQGDMHGELI